LDGKIYAKTATGAWDLTHVLPRSANDGLPLQTGSVIPREADMHAHQYVATLRFGENSGDSFVCLWAFAG